MVLHFHILLLLVGVACVSSSLESELRLLNKPPRKTITTEEGDILDCIDIYKQPTLDHQSLQNHKIQLRPSSLQNDHVVPRHYLGLKYIDCPTGTVPIRRTRKEDLIRAKSHFKKYSSILTYATPGKHLAIIRSVPDQNIKYKGIQGKLNVYNPKVLSGQSSSSQIWIENGAPNVRNSLQAGWIVSPELFNDNLTRSFAYWSVQGQTKQGCFNLLCKGFIQTETHVALGGTLPPSKYGNDLQQDVTFRISQDLKTGNWWLSVPNNNIVVGYWPKSLFPLLADGASQVVWGGQVISSRDGASPEMGNGYFPDRNISHGTYISSIKIVEESGQLVVPAGPTYRTESFVDAKKCYNVLGPEYVNAVWEYSIVFGGPGGNGCGV